MSPSLEIDDVCVASADGVEILRGVTLSLAPGEVLGLVGESGCGKSMTGAAALGMLPLGVVRQGGTVRIAGREIGALSEADLAALRGRQIALVPQDAMSSLNPTKTVGRHLADVLARHQGLRGRAASVAARELLARAGLVPPEKWARSYPHELSGGMTQRVAIARALAGDPDVLIADEPTTALDVTTQARILSLLQGLVRGAQRSLLFITHDLGVVAQIADRIAVMYCGRIVETAPVARFFEVPLHPYSVGLRASVPPLDRRQAVAPLPGSVPPPGALPGGCAFHPRCARALPICRTTEPELAPVGPAWVACHAVAGEAARPRGSASDALGPGAPEAVRP